MGRSQSEADDCGEVTGSDSRGGEWLEVGGRKGRMLEECLGRGEERAIRNLGIGKDEKIWCVLESKRREESRVTDEGARRGER